MGKYCELNYNLNLNVPGLGCAKEAVVSIQLRCRSCRHRGRQCRSSAVSPATVGVPLSLVVPWPALCCLRERCAGSALEIKA